MTDLSLDPAAIDAVRAGDRRAFEVLFRHWYTRLAGYALGITRNADTAEDVVQDVLIAVWERRASLPEADRLAPYLFRAVRNRALNQVRDRQTAERWAQNPDAQPQHVRDASDTLAESELALAIERAKAELPARTREVFTMSRDDGLTYQQIADVLEISVKTVETLMGRALRTLREKLRD